jgi:rRNA-processing protein FCF1
MTYEGDVILPMIQKEIAERLTKFDGMTKEEESIMLALTAAQKDIVVNNDRKLKNEFLGAAPPISHGTVKETSKYKSYVAMAKKATTK